MCRLKRSTRLRRHKCGTEEIPLQERYGIELRGKAGQLFGVAGLELAGRARDSCCVLGISALLGGDEGFPEPRRDVASDCGNGNLAGMLRLQLCRHKGHRKRSGRDMGTGGLGFLQEVGKGSVVRERLNLA